MANSTPQILITGGTGFAGTHLVELLVETHSPDSIHLTHLSGNIPSLLMSTLPEANVHRVDLTIQDDVTSLFDQIKPTQIYHLASVARVGDSFQKARFVLQTNIAIQLSVLEALRFIVPNARLVSIFSAENYQPQTTPLDENSSLQPSNPYGISKYTQELLTTSFQESFNLDIVKVRPFNHIGEGQTPDFVIPAFAAQIAKIERNEADVLQVGNLKAVRDFSDVKDVVRAYQLLMSEGQAGEVYNVGSGVGTSIQEMLDMLVARSKIEIQIQTDPSRMRPVDVPYVVADVSRLKALGWRPKYSLDETLDRVLNYWRNQS